MSAGTSRGLVVLVALAFGVTACAGAPSPAGGATDGTGTATSGASTSAAPTLPTGELQPGWWPDPCALVGPAVVSPTRRVAGTTQDGLPLPHGRECSGATADGGRLTLVLERVTVDALSDWSGYLFMQPDKRTVEGSWEEGFVTPARHPDTLYLCHGQTILTVAISPAGSSAGGDALPSLLSTGEGVIGRLAAQPAGRPPS